MSFSLCFVAQIIHIKKGIVYKNQFHIIFCPKYRRKVLVDDIAKDLVDLFYQIAVEKEVTIKSLEVMPDHVHMFIEFDPRLMLHKVKKESKGGECIGESIFRFNPSFSNGKVA